MLLKEIFKGIGTYGRAHKMILKHRLWRYMIIPGIMSLCYVVLIIFIGKIYFADISGYVNENWIPGVMKGGAMVIITTLLLWSFLFLIAYMSYKYVVLILFLPVFKLSV